MWSLERLRYVGKQPLAVMHNFIPVDVVDLDAVDLAKTGLVRPHAVVRASSCASPASASAHAAPAPRRRRCSARRRALPCSRWQRTAYDNAGRAVEYGRHAYRPDLYAFELTLVDR